MAKTRIDRIDQLFQSSIALPLDQTNADNHKAAVGIIQELLTCQGYKRLPTVRSGDRYGQFNAITIKSLKDFRFRNGLQKLRDPVVVDHWTLRKLAELKASSARASRGYIALALDMEITGLMEVLSLVALAEGAGKFNAFNPNSDKQGLSYGIIQWAQKPGRLKDILEKYQTIPPNLFNGIFGSQASLMVAHTQKPKGGVDPKTGETTDSTFNLIDQLWKSRFVMAAEDKLLQKIQIETAITAFQQTINKLRTFADKIQSQRGYAFMIDLANQHGDGGAKKIYETVAPTVADIPNAEAILLAKITDESVRIVRAKYPAPPGKDKSNEELSTQDRRDFFRTTPLLSENDFNEG